MGGSLNATAAGYVGKDPRRVGDSGLSFSVATESGWGDRKKTTWVEITVWGKRADSLAGIIKKGTYVVVSGEAGIRKWESSGKSGAELEINADRVTLGPKTANDGNRESGGYGGGSDDPVPF